MQLYGSHLHLARGGFEPRATFVFSNIGLDGLFIFGQLGKLLQKEYYTIVGITLTIMTLFLKKKVNASWY